MHISQGIQYWTTFWVPLTRPRCVHGYASLQAKDKRKTGNLTLLKTINHYIMGIRRHIKQATKSSVNLPWSTPTTVWGRTGWQDSFNRTFLTNVSWKEVDTAPLKGWENTSGQMFFKNYKFVKHWTVLQQENACATKLLLHSRLLLLSPYQGSAAVRLTIVCSVCFTTSHIPSDRCNSPYHVDLTGIDLAELFDWLLLFLETQHCVCIVFASSFIVFIASYIWRVAWENSLQSRLKAIYGGSGGA